MSNVKRLKDKDGNYIYPVTHADAVFDNNGKSIGDAIYYATPEMFGYVHGVDSTEALNKAISFLV